MNKPFLAFVLNLFMMAGITLLQADSLQQQVMCPVCRIEFTAFLTASSSAQVCIDGRPVDGRIGPLTECPLCRGVFGELQPNTAEVAILKQFVWSGEFQAVKDSDPAIRYATLLQKLERDDSAIAQAWLQTAWVAKENSEQQKTAFTNSLKFFENALVSEKPEKEKLFELSIRKAEILRQLARFAEAQAWLEQMQNNNDLKHGWFPMIINHCLKLVAAKNSKPAPLPAGNPLHTAIAEANTEKTARLAADKTLLEEINGAGQTPLLQAVSARNAELVELLLKVGADTRQSDLNGNSALHYAVSSRNIRLLKLILPAAANPDPINSEGKTPLLLAAENGTVDMIEALLQAGADYNSKDRRGNTILHILSLKPGYGREALVKKLASMVRDVNLRNFDDYTPLHLAAMAGNLVAVRALLDAGARIDARLPDGSTVLFFCKPVSSSSLIGLGADIGATNNAGHTAVVHARLQGDKERLTFLKRTGRFGTAPRKFHLRGRETNIFKAVKDGALDDVREIIAKDTKQLEFREKNLSETPLHTAVTTGNPEMVKLLVELGANVNCTNEFMRTPMHYAAAGGHLDVVKILHAAGANLQAVDFRGSTPLHDAAAARHRKVYIHLLELDASDTTRDNAGKSPAELFNEP